MAVRWISEADLSNPSSVYASRAIEIASWLLYKLTAEKYPGTSQRVEWYGLSRSFCFMCVDELITHSENYLTPHSHVLYRDSTAVKSIRLRGTPVSAVTSVEYGGEVLDPTEYWVINSAFIERRDGQCWDLSQGLLVTYTAGINPPQAGKDAAIILADEIINGAEGSSECSLPSRVVSVSRQGMDYSTLDPQEYLSEGRTGIYEVDLFIKAANPKGARKKPRVFSVDVPFGTTRR